MLGTNLDDTFLVSQVVAGQMLRESGGSIVILERVADVMPAFRHDFENVSSRVEKLEPYLLEAHRRSWAEDVGGNRLFTGR